MKAIRTTRSLQDLLKEYRINYPEMMARAEAEADKMFEKALGLETTEVFIDECNEIETHINLSEAGTKAVFDALGDTSPPNAEMIEAAVQYNDIINMTNVPGEIEAIQLKTNEADSDYAAVCTLVNSNLWAKFSEIQCATCISPDAGSVERFLEWIESGDDEDAWS